MEMQKLLSEPNELTSKIREESDCDTMVKHIKKRNADDAKIINLRQY